MHLAARTSASVAKSVTNKALASASSSSLHSGSGMSVSFSASSMASFSSGNTMEGEDSWTRNGVVYRRLPSDFSSEELFQFNKTHGTSPLNFIPDGPVKEHFNGITSGNTLVWAAFMDDNLVGLISAGIDSGYWKLPGASKDVAFIHEFAVSAAARGKNVGGNLAAISVDARLGVYGVNPAVEEMYTTVHEDNIASRKAFLKGGYQDVVTYDDAARERNTTVMKHVSNGASADKVHPMRIVGVQSGNAVDGIDVGIFDFHIVPTPRGKDEDPRKITSPIVFKTLANKTFPFTKKDRDFVLALRAGKGLDSKDYAEGNYLLGNMFGDCVNSLIEESGIDKSSIDIVSSHGQTITGHPHWEFGDLNVIAQKTGITTVGDFRPADVAAGGNGTPCTCTFDSFILRPRGGDKWRIAINIGGTSSMTFCPPYPPAGEPDTAIPGGLDPGLGVFFMDLAVKAIDPSLDYDDDGKLARSGTVHKGLLEEFLQYKYWQQTELPIGVGPEDFPETLFQSWQARAREEGVSDVDFLTTMTEVSVKQLALAASRFGGPNIVNGATQDVVMRGGVCNNSYWMERLKANLSEQLNTEITKITTLDELGIDEESWENAQYALFGYLAFNGWYNFVPSCTGASRHVVGGRIAPGENFHSVTLKNRL